jgi:CHASE1-domain containing sensor protein
VKRPSTLALAVFLGLAAVTAIAAVFTARQVDQREEQLLDERARSVVEAIDRRIETYTEKLFGVRGAFAASEKLSHAEYDAFLATQGVSRRYPGVLALGYADLVPDEGRDRFIRAVDRSAKAARIGYPDFVIRPNAVRPAASPSPTRTRSPPTARPSAST